MHVSPLLCEILRLYGIFHNSKTVSQKPVRTSDHLAICYLCSTWFWQSRCLWETCFG